MERNVLGRGLSALIPDTSQGLKERIENIPIDRIKITSFQPRQRFSQESLKELADSIQEKGMIHPILVRPVEGGYELIAGERRLKAAELLKLKEIPAVIRKANDSDLLEIALIENIQREELNKMEEARAYNRLSSEFGLTHEMISRRVGKDRTTVSNTLRLLELPEKIQRFLEDNTITMGHAKSILTLGDEKNRLRFCQQIIKRGLSVRQAENVVRHALSGKKVLRIRGSKDPNLSACEERLQHYIGTRVRIIQGKERGKIVIDFYSTNDLNRILEILMHGQ